MTTFNCPRTSGDCARRGPDNECYEWGGKCDYTFNEDDR